VPTPSQENRSNGNSLCGRLVSHPPNTLALFAQSVCMKRSTHRMREESREEKEAAGQKRKGSSTHFHRQSQVFFFVMSSGHANDGSPILHPTPSSLPPSITSSPLA
jgi:hypothetical protein